MKGRPVPLSTLLRRGHWRVALVAVLLVGLMSSVGSLLVLRTEVARSLELVARATAYATEAAVLFHDSDAAQELLAVIARDEHLASIEIVMPDGERLASVYPPAPPGLLGLGDQWATRLFGLRASQPVSKDGRELAEVRVRGDGDAQAQALGWYLLAVLGAMATTAAVVVVYSRRIESDIADELDGLARLTRSIRDNRAFYRRAPPARVAEIQALGEDFNALLADVQAHEDELLARHARLRSDNASLWQRAAHDPLTGLPNRNTFRDRLQTSVDRARSAGQRLGVMFVDVDRFKQVNDEFGHDIGDQLLIEIARRMGTALREADLVGRLGGDEFAVLLEPMLHAEDAVVVAGKIEQAVAEPLEIGPGRTLVPSVSIGLSTYPEQGATADELLRSADLAMYAVKRSRRDNGLAAA